MSSPLTKSAQQEYLKLARLAKTCLQTAESFGEEDFLRPQELAAAPRRVASALPAARAVQSSKEGRLKALYQKYGNCQNCGLGKSRNKIVFGMGSFNPKVLFIGEGPGYEEDRQGLPFVGRSGTLLNKIMASIGLDRNSVYIANIVKCHPMKDPAHPESRGNDRPPEPEEMEACRTILEQQIDILEPPLMCSLGSSATKALLRTEEGISKLRGRVFEFEVNGKKIPLIPTYHPAALLRNNNLKKEVWHDMKMIRDLLKSST